MYANKNKIFDESTIDTRTKTQENEVEQEPEQGYESSESKQSYIPSSRYTQKPYKPSKEEITNEKHEILYQFDRLKRRGFKLPRTYTSDDSIDVLRYDYAKLKNEMASNSGLKFCRNILVCFVSGSEFLTTLWNPLKLHLDGFSTHVYSNVEDYDDVFLRLQEKWGRKIKMSPELELIMLLGGSLLLYHLSNTFLAGPNMRGGPDPSSKSSKPAAPKEQQEPMDGPDMNMNGLASMMSMMGGGGDGGGAMGMLGPMMNMMMGGNMDVPMSGDTVLNDSHRNLNFEEIDEASEINNMLPTTSGSATQESKNEEEKDITVNIDLNKK